MSSLTLTLTGNSSSLTAYFHPEIVLDNRFNYSCSLLDFYTYNSIPNIHENNNKFYYRLPKSRKQIKEIVIPVGSYEIDEIGAFLKKKFHEKDIQFSLRGNRNTMRCEIEAPDIAIDFQRSDSIGQMLGFNQGILEPSTTVHESNQLVNIHHINSVRIDCDLTAGSYHNGQLSHTIYEFSPSVNPGYKINEQPRNLIYLPVVRQRINNINIRVVDQSGQLVDFRGETITCRIHIRKE